jgi:hypothetical protein
LWSKWKRDEGWAAEGQINEEKKKGESIKKEPKQSALLGH